MKRRPTHLKPVDDAHEPESDDFDPSHPFLPGVEPVEGVGVQYDPREFIWPASDDKGQSRKLWVRVPPMLEHQIAVIVAAGKFPYTFPSDLVRHAIMRHVGWLLGMEASIPSYVQHMQAMGQILGHVKEQQAFSEFADTVDTVISDLVVDGPDGRKEALKLLLSLLQQLGAMEDGYWKDKTKERILRKHGSLLDLSVEDVGDVALAPDDGDNNNDDE